MSETRGEVGRFFKHSMVYAIGNALNRVGAFLLLPLYTTYLTVAQYGALELFYTISTAVSGLLAVGIAHATLRFYYEYPDDPSRRALVSTNYIAMLVLSIIGASTVAVFSGTITDYFFPGADYRWSMWLILATMVFELGSQVCLAYVRAIERSMFFVSLAVIKLVVQVALNIWLVSVMHAGVEGVLFGNMVAVFAGWLVLTVFTLKHCGFSFQRDKLMAVLHYSWPFLATTIITIIGGNADRFFISQRLNLTELGVYALAMKFALLIGELVGEPFNRSYGAFRFSIMKRADAGEIQARIFRYLCAATMAVGLGIVMFTRELLMLTSDPAYWRAADFLPLLVLMSVLRVLTYPLQTGIMVQRATRQLFYIRIVTTVIGLGLAYALIGPFGIGGACLTVFTVSLVEMAITDMVSQRYFKVQYEWRRLAILLLLTTLAFLAALPMHHWSFTYALIGKSILWLSFVIVLALSPVFSHEELALAKAKLASLFGRKVARP